MHRFLLLILVMLCGCLRSGMMEPPYGIIEPPDISVDVDVDSALFAVIGDYGQSGKNEKAVSDMVGAWGPDFILTTGDNNYGYGEYATLHQNIGQYYGDYIYNFDAPEAYRCKGKAFTEQINRFFPSPGNHDEQGPYDLEPYLNYFSLPGEEEFYSFAWGPVEFFSLNSLNSADHTKQKAWLKDALAASGKAFQVVYFHHPPYSPGRHGSSEHMQWDFYGWGADVVLAGHDHIYARMVHEGQDGLTYLVNGVGGKSLYNCHGDDEVAGLEILCCEDRYFGAMRCRADSTQLVMEFLALDDPDHPLDRLVITRESP